MKFALPILTADGREFANAKTLAELIGGDSSGHYLLGNHRKWHGGIHISDASAPWCRDKHPVRAMADGKVVAFRMMEEYLVSEFQGESLRYSNCFCLIEHAYCETNPDTQAQNAFTFYTLYMHLKPWQPDQDGEKLVLKKPWNVRNSAPHHHPDAEQQQADARLPKVPLPARTELEPVADCEPVWGTVDGKDYRFIKVSIQSALPQQALAEGKRAGVLLTQGSQVWVAEDAAALERVKPPQPLWLFDQIEAELTCDMVGHADPQFNGPTGRLMVGGHNTPLPSGTLIEYDAHQLAFHWQGDEARKMARCRYRTPSQGRLPGRCGVAWVCVEESHIRIKRQTPSHLNQLYVLPSPVAIAAGETVGFLGLMESPATLLGGKQSKHQVHLELFTQDPRLDAVLANQAATVGGTRYARVPAGLALYEKRDNQWVDSGQQSEAALLTAPKVEKNGDNQWLCVKEGAYVRKEQAEMLSQHDWLKLGFKKVDGSGSDGYLDPQQAPAFFQELAHCLDTNQDGHLSSEEITAALYNLEPLLHSPQSRSRLQKLIVRHPSEWYDKSTDASHQWLDKLKAQVAQPEFDQLVEHERKRIDQLEWMQSATSLKLNRDIWHFWPLGMVDNIKSRDIITIEMVLAANLNQNKSNCERILPYLNQYAHTYGLQDLRVIAHFLSQIAHESSFLPTNEDLFYSPQRMRMVFGCKGGIKNYMESQDDCKLGQLRSKLWTDESKYAYNPQALGSYVYANRMGNGDEASGDGYKYRGRGIIQLTGKSMYKSFTDAHNARSPDDLQDFVDTPDAVTVQDRFAVESAFYYWYSNPSLSNNVSNKSVEYVTKLVNAGINGYENRLLRFNKIADLVGINPAQS